MCITPSSIPTVCDNTSTVLQPWIQLYPNPNVNPGLNLDFTSLLLILSENTQQNLPMAWSKLACNTSTANPTAKAKALTLIIPLYP